MITHGKVWATLPDEVKSEIEKIAAEDGVKMIEMGSRSGSVWLSSFHDLRTDESGLRRPTKTLRIIVNAAKENKNKTKMSMMFMVAGGVPELYYYQEYLW